MHAGGALDAGVCTLLDATIAAAKQVAPLEVEANSTTILLGLSVVAATIPAPAFVSVRWFRWPCGSNVRQKLSNSRHAILVPFEVSLAP
jgi:hypothetical protein